MDYSDLHINLIRYEICHAVCNSYDYVRLHPYCPKVFVETYVASKFSYKVLLCMRFCDSGAKDIAINWEISKQDLWNAEHKKESRKFLESAALSMMRNILETAKQHGFIASLSRGE